MNKQIVLDFFNEKMESTFHSINAETLNFERIIDNMLLWEEVEGLNYIVQVEEHTAVVLFTDYNVSLTMTAEKKRNKYVYQLTEVKAIG